MRARLKIEYWLLRALLSFLRRMPEKIARITVDALTCLWYVIDHGHRSMAVRNISASVKYPWSRKPRTVARANFRNIGRNLVEFARMKEFDAKYYKDKVEFVGEEHLEKALSKGRGIFFLTAHMGNWELMGAAYISRGRKLSVVARPMKNELVDDLINRIRSAAGMEIIPHRGASWKMINKLVKGEALGVLLDQNALRKEAVFVDFMGRPAATNYGLSLLARKTGSPVLPVFIVRHLKGGHLIRFMPEIPLVKTDNARHDVIENTTRYTAAIEKMVSSHPEQWFWIHNRWKNQPVASQQ